MAALRHARPDDELWATLRVMAFTDEHDPGRGQDRQTTRIPAAEKLLGDVLIKRRDKIGRVCCARSIR